MAWEPLTGEYVDCRVARGFPLGGIGTGGLGFDADGSFGEMRFNNNWMCPVRGVRGAFHALFTERAGERRALVLRRAGDEAEYGGLATVRSTRFEGMLPGFTLRYEDDLPLAVELAGVTAHVPHVLRDSTLPAAIFRFRLSNRGAVPVAASVLFAFENVLGRGGSGHLGLVLGPEHEVQGVRGRAVYDSVGGNFQEETVVGAHRGVRFRTDQRYADGDHRRSVTGEYLLLAEEAPGQTVTVCAGWDAADPAPAFLVEFARSGRLPPGDGARRGVDGGYRPAAAVAAATTVAPHEFRDVVFLLVWWTADHVTERELAPDRPPGPRRGERVGHVYENWFHSVDEVAAYTLGERMRLEAASTEVTRYLAASTLPSWLVRAIANSIDSTLCNTVVPRSGAMYTLEGVDWPWPMGGLTGTSDQRLVAHPYTSVFFTELDVRELIEFRRLADPRGAIPHGNGNCDLGLGTTDVPYGWPLYVRDFLPAKEWTDLTMSFVLQVGKLWRTTGRWEILHGFWPSLVRAMDYLDGLAPRGVPEGGTTYDVWDFPGAFAYSATLYLATLATVIDVARHAGSTRIPGLQERHARCAARLDELWDARGYYRTSEHQDSIFTAALAGDWAARYAGLPPVVPASRGLSHLRHAHRVLVTEAVRAAAGRHRALPRAEARFDGTPVRVPMAAGLPADEEMTYVWQVLSYQAMEQIYLGEVAAGLETLRLVYDRLWHDGNAWSGGLRGNGESIYMSHPVAWAVLNALTGAALDVPGRTLHLAPRLGGEITALRCPFFFPPFWAWLEHDPRTGALEIEVLRTFGDAVTIERVVERTPSGAERVTAIEPTALVAGRRLRVSGEAR